MMNGFEVHNWGMGWGSILGFAVLVSLIGIYVKIEKNKA
jgi:hypothetical protein